MFGLRFDFLRSFLAFFLIQTAVALPSSAGQRWFSGAGGFPGQNPLSSWTRPAVADLPEGAALWESTAFFVTESGQYSLENAVRTFFGDEPPELFPRVLFLYSHRFDPEAPADNLIMALDGSDGRALVEGELPLIANNIYLLVLSTVDESRPGDDDGYVELTTTLSGPGEIGRNYCRFVDDVDNDADGDYWRHEAAMAYSEVDIAEQICLSASWRDPEGKVRTAYVAPQRTLDSVQFYFFEEENWEINAKILDACEINDHYWLLVSASTDQEFELRMRFLGYDAYLSPSNPNFEPYFPEDPTSGGEWVYTSPGGEPARSVVDLVAIKCEYE